MLFFLQPRDVLVVLVEIVEVWMSGVVDAVSHLSFYPYTSLVKITAGAVLSTWRESVPAQYMPMKFGCCVELIHVLPFVHRFKDEKDDRSMEADWRSIQAEERRSARLGRSEDERAEHEELARQKAKAAKKKAKRPNTGFLLG